MKVTFDKKVLADALGVLARVIDSRNTVAVLANVALDSAPGGVRMRASDLDREVAIMVAAEVTEEGALTLPCKMLHDIVARLKDGAPVVIEEIDKGRATVKSGRSRFVLPTVPFADYPDMAERPVDAEFELPGEHLAALMGRPAFAIADDASRYYLAGVFLHPSGDRLRAVATNGHELARLDRPLPEGAAGMPAVIVPEKTVRELAKLAQGMGKAPVRLKVSPNLIRCIAGATEVTSKLIDGTFPDYSRVIPSGNDKEMVADRAELGKAVERVKTLVPRNGHPMKLTLSEGRLTLSLHTDTGGEASEEIEVDYEAPPIEIGFNSSYLSEIIESFGGKVMACFADAGSPTLFRDPDDENWLVVLMPMRV